MANPFVNQETYDVEVVDPRDGERWNVTLRVLNAGDRAALQDETVIETDDSGEDRARVPMGKLRMKALERAVVSWTLPMQPGPNAIAVLHEAIFDQLYEAIRSSATDLAGPPTEAQTGNPNPEDSGVDGSSTSS
jgi:hypothetical protein